VVRVLDLKRKKLLIFLFFILLNILPQIFVIISKPDNLMNWYLTDDAFYYFKVAQNIAEGNGITFDGINPTNGFHPLWMIICIPIFVLARFNLFLPLRIVAVVQIILNAASGYFLYAIISEKISNKFAWIASIFWMFFPPIHGITTKLGLETGLTSFMLISFFYFVSRLPSSNEQNKYRRQLVWVGLWGTGVLFSRLDNIFVLLMVGIWLVFREKKFGKISQIDFLLILIAAVISFFIRLSSNENIFEFVNFLYLLIGISLIIKPTMLYIFDAYKTDKTKNDVYILKNILFASILSSALIFASLYFFQNVLHILDGFPRSAVLIDWGVSLLLVGSHHYFIFKRNLLNNKLEEDIAFKSNWRTWVGRALSYFVPIAVFLIIYLLLNVYYADTAMPVSGQIKRWWGTLPNSIYGQPERTLFEVITSVFDPNYVKGPFWIVTKPIDTIAKFLQKIIGLQQIANSLLNYFFITLVSIIVMFLFQHWLKKDHKNVQKTIDDLAILPLFIGTFFQVVMYKSTGYLHVREWYWVGEMILIVLVLSIIFSTIFQNINFKLSNKNLYSIFILIFCCFLWVNFSTSIHQQFPLDGNVPLEYDIEEGRRFIGSQTEPGDVIGMTGGGLTAYFNPDRRIINLDGLINSAEYFSQLKEGNITDFMTANKVKYIFGSELALLDSDPYRWFFTDALLFKTSGSYFQLYLYNPIEK
jgi:hypothetical protein